MATDKIKVAVRVRPFNRRGMYRTIGKSRKMEIEIAIEVVPGAAGYVARATRLTSSRSDRPVLSFSSPRVT